MTDKPFDDYSDYRSEQLEDEDVAREYRLLAPRYEALQAIVDLRHERGLTQQQLAERAQKHQSQVSRFESGDHDVMLGTLAAFADALDAEVRLSIVPKQQAALFDWAFEVASRVGRTEMPAMKLEGIVGHDTFTFITNKATFKEVGDTSAAKGEMKEMESPWKQKVAA